MQQMLVAGRYRLVRLIGRGGMGRVWLADDELLHREVAAKEIHPPGWLGENERDNLLARTMREARTAARLTHPNVVRVYDVVQDDGSPWIIMEYVPSRSLQEILEAGEPFSPRRAAELGLAMLDALRAAHRAGVLHRDVKPHNMLVAEDGRLMLTDFGLATFDGEGGLTRSGVVLGSPQYVAPERVADGVSTMAGDLWSLGASLYAAVEGHSPYARSTPLATLAALATEPPDLARNAGPLGAVLAGLLRRNPRQRLTAVDAERLLRQVLEELPAEPAPSAPDAPAGGTDPAVARAGPSADRGEGAADRGGGPTDRGGGRTDHGGGRTDHGGGPTDHGGGSADRAADTERVVAGPRPVAPGPVRQPSGDGEPSSETPDAPSGSGQRAPGRRWWPAGWRRRQLLPAAVAAIGLTTAGFTVVAVRGGPARQPVVVATTGATDTKDPQLANPTGPGPPGHPGGYPGDGHPPGAPRPVGPPPFNCVPPPPPHERVTAAPGPAGARALPSGWTWHTDDAGFRIAAPLGWEYFSHNEVLCFHEPFGQRVLIVDPSPAGADAGAYWRARQLQLRGEGGVTGYELVATRPLRRHRGAEWEFRWTTPAGTPVHTSEMLVEGETGPFVVVWHTPEIDWSENGMSLSLIRETFESTR